MNIILTDKAKEKILLLSKEENFKPIIRVGIKGGGCAGFYYDLFFEQENNIVDTDHKFEFDEVKIIVDMMSMTYLEDTTIDYVDDLMSSGFKFNNPKAKSSCGCEKSFTF